MKEGSFGGLLRQARAAAGMNQRDAAAAVGVHFTYLSKIETGQTPPPSIPTLLAFCRLFHVDPLPFLRARRGCPAVLESLSSEQWLALWDWLGR